MPNTFQLRGNPRRMTGDLEAISNISTEKYKIFYEEYIADFHEKLDFSYEKTGASSLQKKKTYLLIFPV